MNGGPLAPALSHPLGLGSRETTSRMWEGEYTCCRWGSWGSPVLSVDDCECGYIITGRAAKHQGRES